MNWILLLAIAVLAAVATDSRADTPGLRPELVDTPYLAARGIAMHFPVIGALRIMDKRGEHLLVLTRNADLSPSRPKSPASNTSTLSHIITTAAKVVGRPHGRYATASTALASTQRPTSSRQRFPSRI